MGLDGMGRIFKQAASHKLDAIILFRAISCFKNLNHWFGWDGGDLQTGNFFELDVITFSKQF